MNNDYVHQKIKEALDIVGGDRHDAQKLLITWAVRDMQLLLGLTKPHLKAIATAAVDHAMRHPNANPDNGVDHISKRDMDDILKKSPASLNLDKRKKASLPPPKSTQRQADAMRKLAAAYTKKKGEE